MLSFSCTPSCAFQTFKMQTLYNFLPQWKYLLAFGLFISIRRSLYNIQCRVPLDHWTFSLFFGTFFCKPERWLCVLADMLTLFKKPLKFRFALSLREFEGSIQRYQWFFSELPEMLCESEMEVEQHTCWSGRDVVERCVCVCVNGDSTQIWVFAQVTNPFLTFSAHKVPFGLNVWIMTVNYTAWLS